MSLPVRRRRLARRRTAALVATGAPSGPAAIRRGSALARLGGIVAMLLVWSGLVVDVHRDPTLERARGGAIVLAGICCLISPLLGLAVGVLGWHLPRLAEQRRIRRRDRALIDETLVAVELCAVAVHSGTSVAQAIELVAPHLDGRLGASLRRVRFRGDAEVLLVDGLAGVTEELGDTVAPFMALLRAAHTDGDRLEPALTRLADRLRDERRRMVETDVRRLSVRLLFPLVCCSLPGFALIAVVPLLVGSLGGLDL